MTWNQPVERDSANMLEKSLRILQAFRAGDQKLRLNDLVERTGMPKSTVHRLARLLIEHQLIAVDGDGYELGIGLFELSGLVPINRGLRETALPFLQDLFLSTQETVHLGVRDGLDVVYVEKIHGHSDLGLPSRIGGRMPLTCTGVGKALLAFSNEQVRQSVLARPLRRITPKSNTDLVALGRELAEIRATGFAFEREEATLGRACVAAPVLVRGEAVAAISVSVPVTQYRVPPLAAAVKTAALGLARRLRPPMEAERLAPASARTLPHRVDTSRRAHAFG
ncbi:IclR family transcriptional regulator [Aeromicrobium sp. YIM 150415]|nr:MULTISPECIES: IclR family transcriptional regulator [Aeromicrobium]MBM9464204.1 IclR family transcriptional regulator [Aeromicrobium sp. YIM 150415]